MPNIQRFGITRYSATLEKAVLSVDGASRHRLALINCIGPNPNDDLVRFVNINFMAEDEPLPPNSTRQVGAQYIVSIYYPASCYAWFIDLLRNEETTYAEFSTDDPKYNRITAGYEPIGEGE
jgi:hypothetical protein